MSEQIADGVSAVLPENNQSKGCPERRQEIEKPENGLKGLKHWKQDIFAGLIVALVSVPLSLGIALASGAPPICGITSEIIAGLIFPLLGGAYVTISGPAAGLAPVLYSSIAALGQGNMEKGYHMVLGVIMFAGITQLVLTYFKAAKFSYLFPRAAVHGMLAAIGFLIIGKQIPNFIGHKYEAHDFFPIVCETPSHIFHLNPAVLATSVICLALLFLLPKVKNKWMRYIPAHLAVVLVGIAFGQFFNLDPKFLVQIPANPLEHGIIFPDFSGLFSDFKLIPTIIVCVFALTFVDGTESLATIHAVDAIDPFKRKSNPHRTLFAMGVSNICSAMIGGLTIIPGIIKSTTCIVSGGRTAWVNFYNAMFLLTFLLFFHEQIGLIPVAALSAVLVHIGYKLAGPHKWQQVINLGFDQLLVFSTTVLVTVCSDLLLGIACGVAMKIAILMYYSLIHNNKQSVFTAFVKLFRNPIEAVTINDGAAEVKFNGPVTCFNNLAVRDALENVVKEAKSVKINLSDEVPIVDHSSSVYLTGLAEESERNGLAKVSLEGLNKLTCCARNEMSMRRQAQQVRRRAS
jgi:Sulfate permease and related transporters (MFS superfamily)